MEAAAQVEGGEKRGDGGDVWQEEGAEEEANLLEEVRTLSPTTLGLTTPLDDAGSEVGGDVSRPAADDDDDHEAGCSGNGGNSGDVDETLEMTLSPSTASNLDKTRKLLLFNDTTEIENFETKPLITEGVEGVEVDEFVEALRSLGYRDKSSRLLDCLHSHFDPGNMSVDAIRELLMRNPRTIKSGKHISPSMRAKAKARSRTFKDPRLGGRGGSRRGRSRGRSRSPAGHPSEDEGKRHPPPPIKWASPVPELAEALKVHAAAKLLQKDGFDDLSMVQTLRPDDPLLAGVQPEEEPASGAMAGDRQTSPDGKGQSTMKRNQRAPWRDTDDVVPHNKDRIVQKRIYFNELPSSWVAFRHR
mmetsp:Transcript_36112/g.78121  ORF Transcript_36112/g.78121 Transcript_36112/m.78121 type:complete len:359 (-) Transcript_36112:60-1136(-)